MSTRRGGAFPAVGGGGRIGSRVDARQRRRPRAERASALLLDDDWKLLSHSVAASRETGARFLYTRSHEKRGPSKVGTEGRLPMGGLGPAGPIQPPDQDSRDLISIDAPENKIRRRQR